MERKQSTLESEPTDAVEQSPAGDSTGRAIGTATADAPAATIAATTPRDADPAANELTIIGHGTPSSFEITVDGEIELLDDESETATTVSGSTVEGTIETGMVRFRFTGDLSDVTFVDRSITGRSPAAVPNVHVDYAAPEETQS